MTAINARFVSPKDRLLSEVVVMAARLPYVDLLSLHVATSRLYEKRLEAQLRSAELAHQQPSEPDPHGV